MSKKDSRSNPNVKIFISAHKPTDYARGECFKPIQVGAGLKGRKTIEGFARDDEGADNISNLNERYCELTAHYWAWKHTDYDYYGFFHYRRYFSFSEEKMSTDIWGNVIESCISDEILAKHEINDKSVTNAVAGYDIILPAIKDITEMPNMGKNMREQFSGSGFLHEEDLDVMLEVIDEKYPEYNNYAKKYLAGHKTYLCNMFIMRKDIFRDYSEWLFDILDECNKRIDFSDYSVEATRTIGHLAERLLNIFVMREVDLNHRKVKELPTVVFLDTDPLPVLKPAFSENNVAIALAADDFYVPYVAAVLASIKDHASPKNNYDIFILTKNINADNRRRLQDILSANSNMSLRFVKMGHYEARFSRLFTRGHFTVETWFRLILPELLVDYTKILYIDSDLIVNADLAELYRTDVKGYLLAACHDADTAGLYNGFEPHKKDYMDNVLKIKNPYEYFQAGVILFNLDEFRKTYSTDEMLKFAASYDWQLLDQDVLNYLAQGRVKNIDMSWNVMFDWNGIRASDIISRAPKRLSDEYSRAHASPKIIHYAGPDKPWHQPTSDYAEVFWKYARMTVFYEEILLRMNDASTFGFFQKTKFKNRLVNKAKKELFPDGSKRKDFARKAYSKFFQRKLR